MSYIIEKNEIEKENNSDIVIAIIEKNSDIFNKLSKKKSVALWKDKNIKIKIGKYKYNDEKYIVVKLPYNIDITNEFITFYKPLITIINIDLNYELNFMTKIVESSNNIIICKDYDKYCNINSIRYINIKSEKYIDKLKKCIYDNSFENLDFKRIIYNDEFEKNICKVKSKIEKITNFNNTRNLAINLLLDKNYYKLINNYFSHEIKINTIKDKKIINKIREKEITKILN